MLDVQACEQIHQKVLKFQEIDTKKRTKIIEYGPGYYVTIAVQISVTSVTFTDIR